MMGLLLCKSKERERTDQREWEGREDRGELVRLRSREGTKGIQVREGDGGT